ncbi:MAG: GNAT family N-acetyltransferase [Chloroflexia bacterium]
MSVEVRLGGPRARLACLALDDGYTTARMWQAATHSSDDPALGLASLESGTPDAPFSVSFQQVRLPRPVEVPGICGLRPPEARLAAWEAAGCLLVACPPQPALNPPPGDADAEPDPAEIPVEVWGYVSLSAVPDAHLAWVAELVVDPEHRRQGLGSTLLDAARAWAAAPVEDGGGGRLSALGLELAPRNYPAISFCRRAGFTFTGYTDYTAAGGDLRLFFVLRIA